MATKTKKATKKAAKKTAAPELNVQFRLDIHFQEGEPGNYRQANFDATNMTAEVRAYVARAIEAGAIVGSFYSGNQSYFAGKGAAPKALREALAENNG